MRKAWSPSLNFYIILFNYSQQTKPSLCIQKVLCVCVGNIVLNVKKQNKLFVRKVNVSTCTGPIWSSVFSFGSPSSGCHLGDQRREAKTMQAFSGHPGECYWNKPWKSPNFISKFMNTWQNMKIWINTVLPLLFNTYTSFLFLFSNCLS